MKKAAVFALILGTALGLAPSALNSQTVQEVTGQMIAALGGRAALSAVKDITYTGSAEMVQYGMNGTITMYQKEPNKIRMDMGVMGMVITQAFDGEVGWFTNPQTGTEDLMNEQQTADMKRQAIGNTALLAPEVLGITYELKPRETLEGKSYIVLDQVFKDGLRATNYIDPETFLTYKTRFTGAAVSGMDPTSEVILSDYQKTGDILMANALTIYQGGLEFVRLKFSKIVVNSGLEDRLFKKSVQ